MYTKQQLEIASKILIKNFPKANIRDIVNIAADLLDALDRLTEKGK